MRSAGPGPGRVGRARSGSPRPRVAAPPTRRTCRGGARGICEPGAGGATPETAASCGASVAGHAREPSHVGPALWKGAILRPTDARRGAIRMLIGAPSMTTAIPSPAAAWGTARTTAHLPTSPRSRPGRSRPRWPRPAALASAALGTRTAELTGSLTASAHRDAEPGPPGRRLRCSGVGRGKAGSPSRAGERARRDGGRHAVVRCAAGWVRGAAPSGPCPADPDRVRPYACSRAQSP